MEVELELFEIVVLYLSVAAAAAFSLSWSLTFGHCCHPPSLLLRFMLMFWLNILTEFVVLS